MDDEPEFSQDGVLNFLAENGGRAANTDLLHKFRDSLSEPSARELFKGFVNAVGLVKQEGGTKYVVLKKKYKHLVQTPRQQHSNGPLRDERANGTPSSEQPAGPPSSEQPAGPPSSEQPAGPPSSEQPAGPPSSEQPAGPPSSEQPAVPPSSEQPAGPPSSEQPAGPPSSEQPSAPPSSEQPAVPPSSEQPAVPPSSEQPAVPPCSEQPAVPPSSEQPAVPPSSEQPAVPPSSEQPAVPPSSEQPAVPPSSEQPAVPPSSEQPSGSPVEQPAGATNPARQQGHPPNKKGEMTRIIALPVCVSVDEERGGEAGGDESSGGGEGSSVEASPPPVAISITVPSPTVDASGCPFVEGGLTTKAAEGSSHEASSQGRAAWTLDEDEGVTSGSRSDAVAATDARDAVEAERVDGGGVCREELGPGDPNSLSQEASSGTIAAVVPAGGGAGVKKGSLKTSKKNSQGLRIPGSPQTKRHNSSSSSSPKSPFIGPNFGGGKSGAGGDSDTESVGSARNSEEDGSGGSFGSPLALEPVEHEWIVSAARADWGNLHGLLLVDPSLALRRDPLTGYTALHWAAKHGKADVVPVLVAAAESAGLADAADVNVRSHGGYTALHVAAMHGHTDVAKMLVGAYEANVNARDYSGRKPWHYLRRDAAWEIRELLEAPPADGEERPAAEVTRRRIPRPHLGGLRIPSAHGGAASDDEVDAGGAASNFLRDMQLMRRQSFAKLLKAPMHKKRHKTQIIHSSSAVKVTRAKEEGDLPVGNVAL